MSTSHVNSPAASDTAVPIAVTVPGVDQKQGVFATYLAGDDEQKARGLLQLIGEDGSSVPEDVAEFDQELALKLYQGMLTIRVMDERLLALQRQGRIGFYGEARGQEASVVGTAAAMKPRDWLVPALREAGAGLFRGMPLEGYIAQIFGNAADVSRGRQMPCHPCDRSTNYVVMSSVVASQIPHAVGIAWAMKLQGDKDIACVGYMGDGATSQGDFHVALNFAGVANVPVVLVCQNNQWAISTPGGGQTAAETYALKGLGYGVESLRVDGNDVFAVYTASKYALEKARRGGGPTFMELLTYRVSAHSSSDDPSRYRDETITDEWKSNRDPLRRLQTFLEQRGWINNDQNSNMVDSIEEEVRRVVAEQEKIAMPAVDSIIEDVYEEPTWLLREQLADLKRQGE